MDKSTTAMFVPVWLNLAEYPFRFQRVEVDGGELHVIDEGPGRPIIFLHGWMSWSFTYRNVIKELFDKRRCLAVDLLGFGLSDKPAQRAYDQAAQLARLGTWLQSYDLSDAIMVAQDVHTHLAIELSTRISGVGHIVLLNPVWGRRQISQLIQPKGWRRFLPGQTIGRYGEGSIRKFIQRSSRQHLSIPNWVYYHYLEPLKTRKDRVALKAYPHFLGEVAQVDPSLKLSILTSPEIQQAYPTPISWKPFIAHEKVLTGGGMLLSETVPEQVAAYLLSL